MAEFYRERGKSDRAVKIYQALVDEDHPSCLQRVEILKALGDALIEAGHVQDALGNYEKLRKVLEASEEGRRLAQDPSIAGPIYEGLGNVQAYGRSYEAAITSYEKALELCRMDEASCEVRNQVILLNNIASCNLAIGTEGSTRKAHELAQLALDIIERKGLADWEVLETRKNLIEISRTRT